MTVVFQYVKRSPAGNAEFSVDQSIIVMVNTAIIVTILSPARQHAKDAMEKGTAANAFLEMN